MGRDPSGGSSRISAVTGAIAAEGPASESRLVRAIGLRDATFLVITNVIGSAIFLTPGTMAATLPSESLLLAGVGRRRRHRDLRRS